MAIADFDADGKLDLINKHVGAMPTLCGMSDAKTTG